MLLRDNIISVLTNFVLYYLTHSSFRQGLLELGENVVNGLITDLASEELALPAAAKLTIA